MWVSRSRCCAPSRAARPKPTIPTTGLGLPTRCMGNRLLVYQALWAMDRLTSPEASVAEKFDRAREARFDGMVIDLGALTMEQAEATVPHFTRTGLAGGLTAFPTSVDALRPALRLAHRIAAPFVV